MKKRYLFPVMGVAVVLACGCQKSPESSIVKNKDLDNMIEQAENKENGSNNVAELAKDYDVYQTTLKDDSFHVSINVDAKVEIPKSSQMSVFRVRQKQISQNLLDQVKTELVKQEKLYDGSMQNVQTRSSIEAEIKSLKNEIELLKADNSYDQESKDIMITEYQQNIDELQEAYEHAPERVPLENYPSDGKLSSVEKLYQKDKENAFYAWEYELNPKGDVYYGVSDGKSGQYIGLYAQNNPDYGNCLRFSQDRHGYIKINSVVSDFSCNNGSWKLEDGLSINKNDLAIEANPEDLIEYTDVSATLSQQQAQEKADQLLNAFDLSEFQCAEGGLYGEVLEADENGKIGYRKVYILEYLRTIDGIFVNNDDGSKSTEGWQGDNYVKQEWSGENIKVIVNDDGIVGFYYNTPIEIMETVVEKSNLKPFQEIKDIFEQMAIVTNAKKDKDESVEINVDQVVLRYTRISEQDRFDTGLLAPVWDFMGTVTYKYGDYSEEKQQCVMTVNAIDGSIIDRTLGY